MPSRLPLRRDRRSARGQIGRARLQSCRQRAITGGREREDAKREGTTFSRAARAANTTGFSRCGCLTARTGGREREDAKREGTTFRRAANGPSREGTTFSRAARAAHTTGIIMTGGHDFRRAANGPSREGTTFSRAARAAHTTGFSRCGCLEARTRRREREDGNGRARLPTCRQRAVTGGHDFSRAARAANTTGFSRCGCLTADG
jgi:hypothetical protein